MKEALGLVEIIGLSTAMVVADTMAKAANVRILEIENTKGLGYITIKITGDVGAVKAAVDAGRQIGSLHQKLAGWKVIPRPSDYVESVFCKKEPETLPEPPEPEKKSQISPPEEPVEEKAEEAQEEPVAAEEPQPEEAEKQEPASKGTKKKK